MTRLHRLLFWAILYYILLPISWLLDQCALQSLPALAPEPLQSDAWPVSSLPIPLLSDVRNQSRVLSRPNQLRIPRLQPVRTPAVRHLISSRMTARRFAPGVVPLSVMRILSPRSPLVRRLPVRRWFRERLSGRISLMFAVMGRGFNEGGRWRVER